MNTNTLNTRIISKIKINAKTAKQNQSSFGEMGYWIMCFLVHSLFEPNAIISTIDLCY